MDAFSVSQQMMESLHAAMLRVTLLNAAHSSLVSKLLDTSQRVWNGVMKSIAVPTGSVPFLDIPESATSLRISHPLDRDEGRLGKYLAKGLCGLCVYVCMYICVHVCMYIRVYM